MKYKIVFLDVDGTIFSHKTKSIPSSCIEAIKLAKENGIIICLATGRNTYLSSQTGLFDIIDFDYFTVCNGTLVHDKNFNLIHSHPINKRCVENLIKVTNENNLNMSYVTIDRVFRVNDNNKLIEQGYGAISIKTPPKKEYEKEDCYMINLFWDKYDKERIDNLFKESSKYAFYSSFNDYGIDVIPLNYNKSKGIEALLKYLGIKKEEAIAIGDGHNDAEMIKYVGLGIAMGNAIDKCKKVADYVTTDIDDNGIYNAFKYAGII
jgi:Cof subfamily protein (haloacid dehalogenase superfamily)